MSTIQIRKKTKKRLDAFADGRSINKAMRELLKDAEVVDEMKICKFEFANIRIDDDLHQKLKKCKKHSKESYSDVIERLLDSHQSDD